MFALGTIALVLDTTVGFQDANFDSSTSCITCTYLWETALFLMCIICDSICAWRTVIIWNKDKRVTAILVFFILVTTVSTVCALVLGAFQVGKSLLLLFVLVPGPILCTNLLSTGLVVWKAWQRRIPVMDHLHGGSRFLRFERVFALLIESGLIYCCIWILYVISMFGFLPNAGFTFMVFVSGIYPTLIVILISKQMSPAEHYSTPSTHSTEMQFTGVPARRPLGDDSAP